MQLNVNTIDPAKVSEPEFDTKPLYEQVHDRILARIEAGEWRPEQKLPCEYDLGREMRVSAGTMRKALDKLESERRLKRIQGDGTYVTDFVTKERERKAECYCNAEQIAEVAGLTEVMTSPAVVDAIAKCMWLTATELFDRGAAYPDKFDKARLRRARSVVARKEAEAEAAAQAAMS